MMPAAERQELAARLRAARNGIGLTQEAVAKSLGVSRPLLVAIEQGQREVRPAELVQLATLYQRQVSDFMRPTPPVELLGAQLRTAAGTSHVESDELRRVIAEVETLGDNYLELARRAGVRLPRGYPPQFDMRGLDVAAAAEDVAAQERGRLGVGDGPINELRRVLEDDIGVRVFAPKMPGHMAGFYAYAEPLGACIAVNAVHPFERQRWSMAHEYGHFMTSRERSEITTLRRWDRQPAHERFAESFAANWLMPRTGLTRRVHELVRGRELTPADVLHLASTYQVSAQAMILRLEDLRLLPQGSYDKLVATGFKPGAGRRLLGLPASSSDTELLPQRYKYLALQLYSQGELSEGQLSQFLRVDRLRARVLVAELAATQDVDPSGQRTEQWLLSPIPATDRAADTRRP
jgi:Zn-dependent peptidase ImmA (M78 family)/transcriptional regulator with XRE-family HTH domain